VYSFLDNSKEQLEKLQQQTYRTKLTNQAEIGRQLSDHSEQLLNHTGMFFVGISLELLKRGVTHTTLYWLQLQSCLLAGCTVMQSQEIELRMEERLALMVKWLESSGKTTAPDIQAASLPKLIYRLNIQLPLLVCIRDIHSRCFYFIYGSLMVSIILSHLAFTRKRRYYYGSYYYDSYYFTVGGFHSSHLYVVYGSFLGSIILSTNFAKCFGFARKRRLQIYCE
jgi:hypothetical protein